MKEDNEFFDTSYQLSSTDNLEGDIELFSLLKDLYDRHIIVIEFDRLLDNNPAIRKATQNIFRGINNIELLIQLYDFWEDNIDNCEKYEAEIIGLLQDLCVLNRQRILDLIRTGDKDKSIYIKVLGLSLRSDPEIEALLMTMLHDDDFDVSICSAWALEKLGATSIVPLLIDDLHNPSSRSRVDAALALAYLNYPQAIEAALSLLHDDDPQVRMRSANALGTTDSTLVVMPLIDSLSDPDERVREQIVVSIGVLTDTRSIEPLLITLHDESPDVRIRSLIALKTFAEDDKQIIDAISQLQYDDDENVVEYAIDILSTFSKDSTGDLKKESY